MLELQHELAAYGYAALLPIAIVEGPAVTVIAAFLASQGLLDVMAVYAVAVVGDLIGDMLHYGVGHWASRRLAGRQGSWATRLRHRIARIAPSMHTRAGAVLLFGKLTHSAGFAVLLAAGATRMPVPRFVLFNLLGTLPKVLLLVAAGYWFGRLYSSLQGDLRIVGLLGFVVAGGTLLLLARRLLAVPDEQEA